MALFIEFVDFFRILLVNWLRSLPVRPLTFRVGSGLPAKSLTEVARVVIDQRRSALPMRG
jgi:hypothetical protein